jgi:dTDP-4-dehydrorhamnose reductase
MLVTGSTGYLGSHLCATLATRTAGQPVILNVSGNAPPPTGTRKHMPLKASGGSRPCNPFPSLPNVLINLGPACPPPPPCLLRDCYLTGQLREATGERFDLTKKGAVLERVLQFDPDVIVHCAALSQVRLRVPTTRGLLCLRSPLQYTCDGSDVIDISNKTLRPFPSLCRRAPARPTRSLLPQ